jgi:hypothetical protein
MSNSPPKNTGVSPPSSPRRTSTPRGFSHHVPNTPSRLRKSVAAEANHSSPAQEDDNKLSPLSSPVMGSVTISAEPEPIASPSSPGIRGKLVEPAQREADARTRLLEDYHKGSVCGSKHCNHGTFSPHVRPQDSPSSNVSIMRGFGGRNAEDMSDDDGETRDRTRGFVGDAFADGLFGGSRSGTPMSTTKWLATKHGVTNQRAM